MLMDRPRWNAAVEAKAAHIVLTAVLCKLIANFLRKRIAKREKIEQEAAAAAEKEAQRSKAKGKKQK